MIIEKEHLQVICKNEKCNHYKTCCKTSTVIFKVTEGPTHLMFIGQGAGKSEDINITPQNVNREPFSGKAGSYLRSMILHLWNSGILFNVAFSNTVRCHPVDENNKDRNPTLEEKENCREILEVDIKAIEPLVLVPLGKDSSNYILGRTDDLPMGKLRGKPEPTQFGYAVPTYHPSYLTRTYGKFKSDEKGKVFLDTMSDITLALRETHCFSL